MFFSPLTSTIRLCLAENSYLQGHRMQCRKCMLLLPIGARRSAYILGFFKTKTYSFKTKTFSKPIPRLAKPYQNQYPKPPKPPQNQYSKPEFQNHIWVWCMPKSMVYTRTFTHTNHHKHLFIIARNYIYFIIREDRFFN